MNDKMILTDVDGVLLHWNQGFDTFMRNKGFTKKVNGEYELGITYGISEEEAHKYAIEYNQSAYIGSLPPLRDAIKYVKKLHEEHGYVFHCISAVPDNQEVWNLRYENLKKLFGTAIVRLDCSGSSDNKRKYLEEYKDSGLPWIEDKIEMAELGLELGLACYLMEHDYNKKMNNNDIMRIKNWSEVYYSLT